jgi:hypothetical protein
VSLGFHSAPSEEVPSERGEAHSHCPHTGMPSRAMIPVLYSTPKLKLETLTKKKREREGA